MSYLEGNFSPTNTLPFATDDVEKYLIFSNRHEIRRLDLRTKDYVSLREGLNNTIALDFWYNHSGRDEGSYIFWTDVMDDKIYKGTLISNCESDN